MGVVFERNGVSGQYGQVSEQGAEAVHRQSFLCALCVDLVQGRS